MTVKTYSHYVDPVYLEELVFADGEIDMYPEDLEVNKQDFEIEVDFYMEDMVPVEIRIFEEKFVDGETMRECIFEADNNERAY